VGDQLPPGKEPPYLCLGGSMGPTAGLDVAEKRKVIASDENRAPTDQPGASISQLLM
jgi:hypothetical protein